MPQFLKLYGEQLVRLGYTVLPIKPGTKRPDIANWPNHATTEADVRKWYGNGRADHGAGVNARNTPAIDVDVMDKGVADALSDEIDQIFAGQSLMTRTGLAPKFLIPFRSDEPFRKLTSSVYTDGKHEHKVEILGDGQQWVAYHVHPDTGKPYAWWNGLDDSGIAVLCRDDLPELTYADAQRVVDAFEVLAREKVLAGEWVRKSASQTESRSAGASANADPFGEAPVGKTESEVAQLLARHRNDDSDYDHWFAVLAAVHHELGDAGRELAHDWSSSSAKHTDGKFDTTWESLGRYTGRQVTLRSLMKGSKPPAPPVGDFVQAAQFASDQRVEWHVKHVIPKRGLIVVYGAPGSSKSFFVLDLVAHVARGLPWRGHRVKQSRVAYIAAEGVAGFGNRLAAYSAHNDLPLDDLPVFVRGGSIMLNESALELAEAVRQLGDVGIVVIDTLAAVTPGANENTSEDMGRAIESANLIVEGTGASVILIHHANKAGELRGWSGLLAAADNTIRVEHEETTGLRAAHVEKQKEGRSSGKYGYRLKVVDLGQDDDGDAITSCVVDECEDAAPNTRYVKKDRKPRSGDFETSDNYKFARVYLRIIEDLIGLGEPDIDEMDVIKAIQGDSELNPMGYEDTPALRSIKRSLHTLGEKGKIRMEGRWIRVCKE
jgi:hypothetical protein